MEWKEVAIKDCLTKVVDNRGKTPKDLSNTGYCLLEINAVSDKQKAPLYGEVKKYVNEEVYSTWFRSGHPQIGDILIPTVGSLGAVSYMTRNDCCIAQNIIALRVNKNVCLSNYLYYQLCNPITRKMLLNLDIGAVQASIKVPHIMALTIPLPPLPIQRRISSILSSLDRKIELNNKINAELEEMAQAIFRNWFVDFAPFKDGKFVDSELGMIPEGWRVGSVYEYVKVIFGAPYKSSLFNDKLLGLPLIRIRDLKDCSPQIYTQELLPQTEYVVRGDILAGMDAEFTPYIWKGEKGLLNQRVCKLKPVKESISNLFALYLLKPELEFVQSYKTGTTVSHLGKADIDKFIVILPPIDIVEKCSKILNPILLEITRRNTESTHLSTLRDTLLPRLMSGEIEL